MNPAMHNSLMQILRSLGRVLRMGVAHTAGAMAGQDAGLGDRFAGCLVGQALGDALGFLVEGHGGAVCQEYVREFVVPRRVPTLTRGRFAFGQYSDDTQLARELSLSMVHSRGFDAADYAARIAAIFSEGRIVGRGRATEKAAQRLAAGITWQLAGSPAPAAGNGSAMRAAPVGLVFANDYATILRVAHEQSLITHLDPRCSAGSIVIAGATALALVDGPLNIEAFCQQLAKWALPFDPVMAQLLEWLPEGVGKSPFEVLARLKSISQDQTEQWDGISPFVTESVMWSVYAFLSSSDDYWQAVCTALVVGGDVDTTGAMTGAIAGARSGLGGLPMTFVSRLTDQGTWGYSKLAELGKNLVEVQA
jgi:ADP-ribosylglycohydrolase